jgi:UDP-glucose 4-epimerase
MARGDRASAGAHLVENGDPAMTRILITGAAGAVGGALLQTLSAQGHDVLATDIRPPAQLYGARFAPMDVRGDDPARLIGEEGPEVVIHLASVVTPPKDTGRDFAYAVDVTGTRNVLDACAASGVRRLVTASSGAAYGYHADNSVPLTEADPIRGNVEFPYAHHKRLVEEMLAEASKTAPQLEQVVLRIGTVLGVGIDNQITALFGKKRLLALTGLDSPFVFIWTIDLARIFARAATDGPAGIYNVAGDGALGMGDIAAILDKPLLRLPPWALRAALAIAHPIGLSRYGPEQVRFLQYRPVLDNSALKTVFGYTPERTSRQVFEAWAEDARP